MPRSRTNPIVNTTEKVATNGLEGVSFVIPAHNEVNFLPTTLESLREAIKLLGFNFVTSETAFTEDASNDPLTSEPSGTAKRRCEIVVANDASTDTTPEIARQHGARVIDVDLRNIGAVRNAGAEAAQFEILIFLDADTKVSFKTIQESILALERGASGGGAHVDLDAPVGFVRWSMFLFVYFVWQVLSGSAAGCYMFCRKKDFVDFGGFDPNYYAAEEYFFSRQLKSRGRFVLVRPEVITSARKLHKYSIWQLSRFLLLPLLAGRNALKSRRGLEVLYDDQR